MQEKNQARKRKRAIIWYNLPYSVNKKTNIGTTSFKLLRKHFPSTHPMYIIFNKSKIKISYSYFPKMWSITSLDNKHILNSNSTDYRCNWNKRDECHLENKCLTPRIVNKADVTNNKTDDNKYYYGISDTPFKDRYENHKTSFRHRSHLTASDMSKYYWKLIDNGAVPMIKFSIAKNVKGNTFINNCNLCVSEKAFRIRNLDDVNILNKRSEFISKCWHISKRLLKRVKHDSNDWVWCVFVFTVYFSCITYEIFLFFL